MASPVNTNASSMVGLQKLNATQRALDKTQEHISTGNKINSPKDDAATLAIAQHLLADFSGNGAVRDGLDRAGATVDVAAAAGSVVADTLIEMTGLAVQASQEGLDESSRQALKAEFNALRDQVDDFVDTAEFGGTNLVAAGSADLDVLSSEEGERVAVAAQDFSSAGLGIATASLDDAGSAGAAISTLDGAITDASSKLGSLGASATRIEGQSRQLGSLNDTLRAGIGNLVDSDLAADSAALKAGQVKEALGSVALGISNAAPKRLLALF